MNAEKLEHLLIEYIDGSLSPEDRAKVEQELSTNEAARRLHQQLCTVVQAMDNSSAFDPGRRLQTSFDQLLQQEVRETRKVRSLFSPVLYRAAAGLVLVMAGIGIGYWINKNQEHENELAALKKEVDATKQVMLVMLDNQQSASQRMMGTTVAYQMERPDDEIVTALVKSMNDDVNTNVRLAALEALIRFHEDPAVRKKLIASLSVQKDPAVQITLIQFLVKLKEKEVVRELKNIVDDAHTIKAVKDEALSGILKLS